MSQSPQERISNSSTPLLPSPQFKATRHSVQFHKGFICTKEKGSGCFSLTVLFLDTVKPTQSAQLRSELAAGICLWPCATRPLPHGFLLWTHCTKWTGKWGSACAYASPETHHSQKVHCKVPNKTTHLCIKRQKTLLTGGYCGKLQRSHSFFRWLGLRSAHHGEHELGFLFLRFVSQKPNRTGCFPRF